MKRIILISILVLFVLVSFSETLWGIPAFARKYRMSCKTCHEPFPRLKAYGEEFAGNGFVLADKKAPRYTVNTGDDKLDLIRDFPFALRMDAFLSYNNSKTESTDLSTPYNIKLLSGGALAKNISYYFYFYFSERGKVVGLEDAFLMFNDVFGSGISLAIGQFAVSDPLMKREMRLTFEDYHVYKVKVGLSTATLSYDRGLMFGYTIPKGPDLVFEVLNGTGIEEANVFKNFDDDKYKNFLGRISQDIGENLRIGAVGYWGKEGPESMENKITMYGGDATLSLGPLELNLQYLERTDDNPYMSSMSPMEVKTKGALAELIFIPVKSDGMLYSVGLFNWLDSDDDTIDYESIAFHVGYLTHRNIRFIAEVGYISKSIFGKYTRFVAGIIAAF